jgi:hypothetical protein
MVALLQLKKRDTVQLLPSHTSAQTIRTVSDWLEECHSTHEECPSPYIKPKDDVLAGIRFLQIHESSILLVENARPDRYNALSHCWGSCEHIVRTDSQYIAAHREHGIIIE